MAPEDSNSEIWSGRRPTVAIIGAGFGGLCMAIQLLKAGIESFTIFEKENDVGGIWRDNTYPGCGCDVPSHLYSFSFDQYRSARKRYPDQRQILEYLHRVTAKYDLQRFLKLGTEVSEARYDQDAGRWEITTRSGERHVADAVVYAVGQLNRPRLPDIPGRDAFEGESFHTARWNHAYDPAGRDVAVVGTGSSAAQLIPHVARSARKLYVFQRTANWVLPKPGADFGLPTRVAFGSMPFLQSVYRKVWHLAGDAVLWPVITRGWSAAPVKLIASRHLKRQVASPELREKLTPDHPIGCKRIVIDSDFYPAMNRSNVELVTDGIERITPTGIETSDGTARNVDAIVYATGFRTTEFLMPIDIRGLDGRDLHEQWRDGAEAYLGVAVPNFPNLFLLHGPNTILGHNSNIYIIECQVGFVMRCLRMLAEKEPGGLDVREEAMSEYRDLLDRAIGRTTWQAGCLSWYKTDAGRVTNPWPGSTRRYQRLLRKVQPDAFRLLPATAGEA